MVLSRLKVAAVIAGSLPCLLLVGGCGDKTAGDRSSGPGAASRCIDSNAPDMTLEEMVAAVREFYEPLEKAAPNAGIERFLRRLASIKSDPPGIADFVPQAPEGGQGRFTAATCDLAGNNDQTYDGTVLYDETYGGPKISIREVHGFIPMQGFFACSLIQLRIEEGISVPELIDSLKSETTRKPGDDPDSVKDRKIAESDYGLFLAALEYLCPQLKP